MQQGLIDLGFKPSETDPGIYFGRGMILILCVDDLLATGPDESKIEGLFTDLEKAGFTLTREETGEDVFHFLGIELNMEEEGKIKFTQQGLLDLGFKPSETDPGIYFVRGMILMSCVDDLSATGPDATKIEGLFTDLEKAGFALTREETGDDVFHFLGIELNMEEEGKIKFTQKGLIKKLLETTGMTECNGQRTPATVNPLPTDAGGDAFQEPWQCSSVIGMMMYLASNAHPQIQFAVHQCARFTHCPKHLHANAVKKICRCLKHVPDHNEGLTFTKTTSHQSDCFVDADYAGLWGHEDDQDPVCVKSRTGCTMTLGGCPIHWVSRLQTETALITLEAEHIALAQAMRDLVPTRRMLEEVLGSVAPHLQDDPTLLKATFLEDNNQSMNYSLISS